jgi:hypothetical protein
MLVEEYNLIDIAISCYSGWTNKFQQKNLTSTASLIGFSSGGLPNALRTQAIIITPGIRLRIINK